MSVAVDLSKYAELFLTEGREHVAEMNAALDVLERAASDGTGVPMGAVPSAAVAALFRGAHTIKGMAGAMGYEAVAARAHALETTLDAVRRGEEPVTPSLVVHLAEEVDALADEVEVVALPATPDVPHAAAYDAATPPDVDEPTRVRARHVRVAVDRLDTLMDMAGELEIARGRLMRVVAAAGDETVHAAASQLSRLVGDLREQVVAARMVPVGQVFDRFPRLVRETARALGKEVEFTVEGQDIELDRSLLDEIGGPVTHLLRNALDHGIETGAERVAAGKPARGRLTLGAQREADAVILRVTDDGGGIDHDAVLRRAHAAGLVDAGVDHLDDAALLRVLAHPGFSTARQVTDISGRGVGLDVVEATVRALGGTVELTTDAGRGTEITMHLPLTIAIVRALLVRLGAETFAVPLVHVVEMAELDAEGDVERDAARGEADGEYVCVRGERLPAVRLHDVLGCAVSARGRPKAATVSLRGRRTALVIDDFVGQQDVVVKRFDPARGAPSPFGGATILSDGAPVLILDVNSLV